MPEFTITPELNAALESMVAPIQEHGLSKLASRVMGLDTGSDRAVFECIGTKLAMQRLEWRKINKGLQALNELTR